MYTIKVRKDGTIDHKISEEDFDKAISYFLKEAEKVSFVIQKKRYLRLAKTTECLKDYKKFSDIQKEVGVSSFVLRYNYIYQIIEYINMFKS